MLDVLEEKVVDTTAYRQQAVAVSMSSTTHYNVGTFYNSRFGGTGSTFTQNIAPARRGGHVGSHYSGSFAYSQFGGDRSTFVQHIGAGPNPAEETDLERLRPLIGELLDLLAAHADRVDHPERARRDAEEILDETARQEEERDPGRIAGAWQRLRARLEPIAQFTEVLGRIAQALQSIIPG